jgi:hypothetical protein
VLPLNYRPPEQLPINQRDFPPRDMAHLHHARDSGLLLLMVIGYLLALLGGIVLLRVLTPTIATITAATSDIRIE